MDDSVNSGKIGYSSYVEFGASDILYMMKDLPDACCIFKVLTDPFGTVKDMLFLFANEKYGQLVGRTSAELIGSTYYKMVMNRDEDWVRYSYQAAILRQSTISRTYNSQYDKWFDFWAVPVYQKGFCAFIIHDVTAVKRNEDNTFMETNTNKLIIECATAVSSAEFGKGMKKVLKIVGQAIQADRVFILETKDGKITDTISWLSDARNPDLPTRKVMDSFDFLGLWNRQLDGKKAAVINDTATLREENEEMYNAVFAGKVSRYIVVPLIDKSEIIGYLIADNHSNELHINVVDVMESVAVFVAAELRNKILTDEMLYLGTHDTLTGLGNRYALNQTLTLLSEMNTCVGVCYSDINGLKTINDENGHEAGDKAICEAANAFSATFKKKFCYRIGGDEFIAIVPEMEEELFETLVDKFKQKAKKLSVAVGWVWNADSKNINSLIQKADEDMYKTKAEYYQKHERRHNT